MLAGILQKSVKQSGGGVNVAVRGRYVVVDMWRDLYTIFPPSGGNCNGDVVRIRVSWMGTQGYISALRAAHSQVIYWVASSRIRVVRFETVQLAILLD